MREDELDGLFAQARAQAPGASPDLLGRVMADALAQMPAPAPAAVARPSRRGSLWAMLTDALGGGLAVTGLGGAALAGLVIGLLQPESLSPLTDGVLTGVLGQALESVEMMPGVEALLQEG